MHPKLDLKSMFVVFLSLTCSQIPTRVGSKADGSKFEVSRCGSGRSHERQGTLIHPEPLEFSRFSDLIHGTERIFSTAKKKPLLG